MLSTSRIRFDTVKRFAIMSHVESFKENLKVFGSKQEIRISNEYLLSPDRKHTTIPRQMDNQLDISKHLLRTLLHACIECHDKDLKKSNFMNDFQCLPIYGSLTYINKQNQFDNHIY